MVLIYLWSRNWRGVQIHRCHVNHITPLWAASALALCGSTLMHELKGSKEYRCARAPYKLQIELNRLSEEWFNTWPRSENHQAGIVSHLSLAVCLFHTTELAHSLLAVCHSSHIHRDACHQMGYVTNTVFLCKKYVNIAGGFFSPRPVYLSVLKVYKWVCL